MTFKRVLLFGAGGQLGSAFREGWTGPGALIAVDRSHADLDMPGTAMTVINTEHPDAVINAAAYTAVDKAEDEPEACTRLNALAVQEIAEVCAARDIPLLHFSSDYVFNGRKSGPYVESDAPDPLSVYGRSKHAGEKAAAYCPKHLILRTSWVFGPHGPNFMRSILRLAGERDTLEVVDDQIGAPTATVVLVAASVAALRQLQDAPASDPRWGLYHLSARGVVSWCGFARWIVQTAIDDAGASLRLQPAGIRAISSGDYSAAAQRPHNSRMDCSKFETAFQHPLPDWQSAAATVLARLLRPAS
jgi:dTDP-4-dehydrorhamnose reductase